MPKDSLNLSPAESLFVTFLRQIDSGQLADFDAFCAEHLEHAAELRELRSRRRDAEWMKECAIDVPQVALSENGPTMSFLRRLRERRDSSQRYERGSSLGEGGYGEVFAVRDTDLERTLAMKVIRRDYSAATPEALDPELLTRFLEEAQITGQLDHPGVVPIHEVGISGEGQIYYTMRVVQGDNLHKVFEDTRLGREGRTLTGCVEILARVCETMAFAHEKKGLIHRDLKPANIMVGEFGEVYVMDWGVARWIGDVVPTTPLPAREVVRSVRRAELKSTPDAPIQSIGSPGTPEFMSPEQARNERAAIGPQSDVYSVGAMLYQLLSGRAPYRLEGSHPLEDAERIAAVIAGPPASIDRLAPGVPAELVAICEKAMARDIRSRYVSMSALRDELRAYLAVRVVGAYEAGAWAEARKWVRRNRALASALGTVLLILSVGGVAFSMQRNAEARRREAEERRGRIQAELNTADLAGERGAWDRVLLAVDRARSEQYPDAADLLYREAEAALSLSNTERADIALADLDRIADLGTRRGKVLLLKAIRLSKTWGHHAECFQATRAALEAGLSGADEAYAKALIAPTTKESLELLEDTIELAPYHRHAYELLISLLLISGQAERAAATCETFALLYRDDVRPQIGLAMAYTMLGDATKAQAARARYKSQVDKITVSKLDAFLAATRNLAAIDGDVEEPLDFSLVSALMKLADLATEATGEISSPSVEAQSRCVSALIDGLMGDSVSRNPLVVFPTLLHVLNSEPARFANACGAALQYHEDGFLYLVQGLALINSPRAPEFETEHRLKVHALFVKAVATPSFARGLRRPAHFWLMKSGWRLWASSGRPEFKGESLARCREYLDFKKLRPLESHQYASLAIALGDVELATEITHKTLLQNPDDLEAQLDHASTLTDAGRFNPAIELYDSVLARELTAEKTTPKRRTLEKHQERARTEREAALTKRAAWIESVVGADATMPETSK
ncbi:MAG TPA: serine/threonine-protein kinase [Planctomycetota bacterium]|nr:serine/threonine-protein kinase [Planctomycetota bacterium]